jgi:hypothetical protein
MTMAIVMNQYQSWCLAVRNAIEKDEPLPIPPNSPPLTREEIDLWQIHIRQTIHHQPPVIPNEWLAERQKQTPRQLGLELWNEVIETRSGGGNT